VCRAPIAVLPTPCARPRTFSEMPTTSS
jgi:hypothetical protein